jgi:hypothetical protein
MALPKSEKALGAIVAGLEKRKPKEEAAEEEGEEMTDDRSLEIAGQAVMDAFKSGDATALTSALRDFVGMCSYSQE